MKARPGRRPKVFPQPEPGRYKPPRQPIGLTKPQIREWERLVRNPALGVGDHDLLLDYSRTMKLRDKASAEIQKKGVVLKDKVNPACRVVRDAQTHILKLRKTLSMNQRERLELQKRGLLESAQDDEDDIYVD